MGREGGAPVMGSVPFRGETPESWRTQREARRPHQWHPAATHLQSYEGQTSVVSAPQSWYFVPTKRPMSPLKIPPYQTTCCSWTGWSKAWQPPQMPAHAVPSDWNAHSQVLSAPGLTSHLRTTTQLPPPPWVSSHLSPLCSPWHP